MTRHNDDLAHLVGPARAALHARDGVVLESVRRARAQTLSRARRHRRRSSPAITRATRLGFAFATCIVVLVASLLVRRWSASRFEPTSISFSVGDIPGGAQRPPPSEATGFPTKREGIPGVVGERIESPQTRVLDFSDGTRVELDARSAARVVSLDDRGGRLVVERGTVRAAFKHRERTYWTVEAGGVVVEVTGTRFDVAWDDEARSFELAMHEGSVRVRGCGLAEGRVVTGTEVVRAQCSDAPPARGSVEVTTAMPTLTPADLPSVTVATPPTTKSLAASPQANRAAPNMATTTDPSAPAAPLDASPAPATHETRDDSAEALLRRADAERSTGTANAARATLLEVRRRFPRTKEAAQATFDLGVLAFDTEHRFTEAASWFERYLDEAPTGPLAREALGRSIEAHSRSGNSSEAARLAAHYLAIHPGGPHASLAKRLAVPSP